MKPETRKIFETMLEAGPAALGLIVARSSWYLQLQQRLTQEDRKKFYHAMYPRLDHEANFRQVVQVWDQSTNGDWESEQLSVYKEHSAEELIHTALELGFVDQAMLVSAAWKKTCAVQLARANEN